MEVSDHLRRSPTASKKFVAFIVTNMGWMFLLAYIAYQDDRMEMQPTLAIGMIMAGLAQATYIGGQSILDRYIYALPTILGRDASKQPQQPQAQEE